MSEASFGSGLPVEGFGPGFFRLGGVLWEGPVVVMPGSSPLSWAGFHDLGPVLDHAGGADLVLLGTGSRLDPALASGGIDLPGLGFEVMPTPSACRVYNVLLAEGRGIGLAALPI